MKIISVAAAALLMSAAPAWAAGTACEALTKLKLAHTEITGAALLAKGAFVPPPDPHGNQGDGAGRPNPLYANLPSFCRVSAVSRSTADSDIRIEVWLPADGWNGRLQAVGNGGLDANIPYNAIAQAVAAGYVGTGTNTGNEGDVGQSAVGHPAKLVDWGNRAVHETAVTAKAVAAAFYGSGPRYSYWNSCSTGGRQGLVAAEYYPADFDGLVVGDAANPMSRLQASTIWNNLIVHKSEAGFIPEVKWDAYLRAVKEQCDAQDGVKDGLINDPLRCKFDLQSMLCKASDRDDCLTAAQLATLRAVLGGARSPRTGAQIFPAWPPGAAPSFHSAVGLEPEDTAIGTFRALFQDGSWDYHTMDFDRDIERSDRLANSTINAAHPSALKALFARGGKILMYHGWTDAAITPLQAIAYYQAAVAANGGETKTSNSIRLFMAPGMNHCFGGDGPNAFDKMTPITEWVEQGKAPDQIVASHSTQGKIDRTRPLCPFPKVAKYKGSGSIDDAANFACGAP